MADWSVITLTLLPKQLSSQYLYAYWAFASVSLQDFHRKFIIAFIKITNINSLHIDFAIIYLIC